MTMTVFDHKNERDEQDGGNSGTDSTKFAHDDIFESSQGQRTGVSPAWFLLMQTFEGLSYHATTQQSCATKGILRSNLLTRGRASTRLLVGYTYALTPHSSPRARFISDSVRSFVRSIIGSGSWLRLSARPPLPPRSRLET